MARTLQPEDRIAQYRIIGPIGAGGMGEVYRAHDTSLERDVALKVLPAALVRSEERVKRFVMEARSASSLNHPHIVTIYEIGQEPVQAKDGSTEPGAPVHYIAMELIQGKTLRELLQQKSDNLKTLLGHLAQAAEGLAKAHDAGIVHRDLKPGNIMVTNDGYAKVLDFGVAKLTQPATSDEDMTSAPTEMGELTGSGQVIGTIAYMSPEQVKGKSVDHRSDVFSFGTMLYEAATGVRPFAADSALDTMHNIANQKPQPVDELNPDVPAELRRVIKRCLAKSPDQRLQSIKDLAIELREIVDEYDELSPSATSGTVATEAVVVARRSPMLSALIAAVVVLGVAGIAFGIWTMLRGSSSTGTEGRPFQPAQMTSLMSDSNAFDAVISGDGRYLAYVKGPVGQWSLWVRQIATGSDVQILPAQTDGISGIGFSPDGNYLYYLGRDPETPDYKALFEVASLGGTPRKRLFDIDTALSFSPDGQRGAFVRGVPQENKDLLLVADLKTGQEHVLATVEKPQDLQFQRPAWSPDGAHIVGVITDSDGVHLTSFDADDGSREPAAEPRQEFVSSIAWQPDGSGLIGTTALSSGGAFQVVRFPYPHGTPYAITNDLDDYSGVSISADGNAITALRTSREQGIWVVPSAEKGTARSIVPRSSSDDILQLRSMPDGTIVFGARKDRYRPLWTMAADGSGRKQITSGSGWAWSPMRLPDGRGLVYQMWSEEENASHVWRVDLDGGNQRQVTEGTGEFLVDLSPDGRTILFLRQDSPAALLRMEIDGGEVEQLLDDYAGSALFSPDGRFLLSRKFKEVDGRNRNFYRILPARGGEPVATFLPPGSSASFDWLPDGSGLVYTAASAGVENIWLQPSDGGEARQLTHFDQGRLGDIDVSPDGTRIAMDRSLDGVENLWTMPVDGGAPTKLSEFPAGIVFDMEWSRDSENLIITQGDIRREVVLLTDAGE